MRQSDILSNMCVPEYANRGSPFRTSLRFCRGAGRDPPPSAMLAPWGKERGSSAPWADRKKLRTLARFLALFTRSRIPCPVCVCKSYMTNAHVYNWRSHIDSQNLRITTIVLIKAINKIIE